MRPSLSQISSRCLKCLTCLRSTQRQPKRARSTRTHFTPATTEPIPPTLQRWIDEITSRPPTTHHDSLDTLRTAQLLRSLPTRQHLDCIALNDGDSLPQGAHMIYFQPETMLKDLGSDGSSPVSSSGSIIDLRPPSAPAYTLPLFTSTTRKFYSILVGRANGDGC